MTPESPEKKSLTEKIGYKLFPNLMLHRKAESLPLQVNWRRIFILPTKPGLFFGLVAFIMLIASLNFNNNMGLMMTFLLVGLAQVALYRIFFNLRNIIIDHVDAKPVFVNDDAVFAVHFKSDQDKYDICIENSFAKDCQLEIASDELTSVFCKRPTTERGWIECGKIKISTTYPFGLFGAWIWTYLDAKCLIYPLPEKNPPSFPQHSQSDGQTTIIHNGEDFHGLKPFAPGDSMHLIAWKRTAQTGELISREFEQTRGEKLHLDFSQINLSDTELKLSRLTAWVVDANQKGMDYCLKLPDFTSEFGHSNKHYLTCMKKIALYGKAS